MCGYLLLLFFFPLASGAGWRMKGKGGEEEDDKVIMVISKKQRQYCQLKKKHKQMLHTDKHAHTSLEKYIDFFFLRSNSFKTNGSLLRHLLFRE